MSLPNRPSVTERNRICAIAGVVLTIAVAAWMGQSPDLPAPQVASRAPFQMRQCAECHQEIYDAFQAAPHAHTLRHMDDADLRVKFASKTFVDDAIPEGMTWHFESDRLWASLSSEKGSLPLDWAFGSGRHAITPVGVLDDPQRKTELIEHRVSWYPPGELGATLGQGTAHTRLARFGKWHSPADAARCFGCHSTRVPQHDGRIDFNHLIANIQCDRCHQGSQQHAAAMQAGQTDTGILRWPALTSREAINRCGECHRRADEFSSDELRPDNDLLARFAPVGLSLSPCFAPTADRPAGDAGSLTCTHCHDPHREAERDPEFYRQRCLECHAPVGKQRPCSVQPPDSHCTTCHMRKVSLNRWLSFTDHWIRTQRASKEP